MNIYSSAERSRLFTRLAFLVFPFALFVALITSGGNYLQYFAFSMLEQGAPNPLNHEQPKDIVQLPSIDDWLLQTFSLNFIILGVAVSIIAFWTLRIRHSAIRFAVAITFGLCISDAYWLIVAGGFNGAEVAKDVLSNVVAGALVAWLACIAMWVYELAGPYIGTGWPFRTFAALTVVALGAMVSATLYYVLFFFVQRTEVNFHAEASPPVTGVHAPGPIDAESGGPSSSGETKFNLLPDDSFNGSLNATAPHGNVRFAWSTGRTDDFNIKVTMFSDCMSLNDALAVRPTRPYAEFINPRVFNLAFDSGLVQTESTPVDGKFAFRLNYPTFYWLDYESREGLKVTEFVDPKDVLSVRPNASMSVFISAPLQIVRNRSSVSPNSREIVLNSAHYSLRVQYLAAKQINPSRLLTCRGLTPAEVVNGVVSPEKSGGVLGVLVDFVELSTPRSAEEPYSSQLRLQNSSGWESVVLENGNDIAGHVTNDTGMFVITKGLKNLYLDDVDASASPEDTIVTVGNIDGRFASAKSVTFTGEAAYIWRNGKLENPTRWERLTTTWQIAVLGWLGTMALGIIKLTRPVLYRLRKGRLLRLA